MNFPIGHLFASTRRAATRLAALALLVAAISLLLTPNLAQAQTINCTGVGGAANVNRSILFNANTNDCTIFNTGVASGAAGILAVRYDANVGGGGTNLIQSTINGAGPTGHTVCDLGAGDLGAGNCTRTAIPDGIDNNVVAFEALGRTFRLNTTYVHNDAGNTFNITFAQVTVISPATGPTAEDKSNTVAALQSSFDAATPGLLDTFESFRTLAPGGNGVSFAPTGLGFAQSRIDPANPMDRDYGSAFAPRGYFDGGQKLRRGNGFNFSVDLTQLANAAANDNTNFSSSSSLTSSPPDLIRGSMQTSSMSLSQLGGTMDYRVKPGNDEGREDALGYHSGGSKDGPAPHQSRLVSFIKGQYVDFDDGETNADRDGHLWVVTSGIGLRVSPDTTIGVLSRYRSGEADSNALDADLDSDFWGGGAFLTSDLGGGLRVSLAGLYEHGDNDIRIGTATGSFDSEHVTIEGRIDKRLERGTFWIEPGIGFRYVDTEQDNYTDSAGTLVTNQDVTLGRLTYGPKIGTTLYRGNATVKPYAKFGGVWDFENEGNFATSTAGTFTSADHGFNAGGGVEVVYLSGFAIHLAGGWTTYDTDLDVWSISGGIGTPLSALGLGQVGFVSLDLSANQQDASAKARLKIPLGKAD